ncbi:hypothetical protein G6L37_01850 [Agrobacterium rubi]|nr:hypothetical protein [Agrobacterium rubi]NTF24136.1 hypothetical protein [Agrobacterium rubi]
MKKTPITGQGGIAGIDDLIPHATIRSLEWQEIDGSQYDAGPWSVQKRVSLWMAFSPFSDEALCTVQTKEAAFDVAQKDFEKWVSESIERTRQYPDNDHAGQCDRVISEGFPQGWFVQDRQSERTAVLVAPPGLRDYAAGGKAVCLKPRLLSTDEWLPVARGIAAKLTAEPPRPQRVTMRAAKPEIRPLSWVGRPADYRPDRMVFRASAMGRDFEVIQNDNESWGPHGRFKTAEAAMQAVQAEYEAPILAAMAVPGSVLPASKLDVVIAEPCAPPVY